MTLSHQNSCFLQIIKKIVKLGKSKKCLKNSFKNLFVRNAFFPLNDSSLTKLAGGNINMPVISRSLVQVSLRNYLNIVKMVRDYTCSFLRLNENSQYLFSLLSGMYFILLPTSIVPSDGFFRRQFFFGRG